MKTIVSLLCLFISLQGFAQNNMVPYSRDYEFKEGIFLSVDQFKQNAPIPKEAIISVYPKDKSDFLDQVFTQKNIIYKDASGNEQKIITATVWGYCRNRTIYINYKNSFNRVNVIGTLFSFTASVRVSSSFGDPMDMNYGMNNSYDELQQFVFDCETYEVYDFNVKSMELLLKNDAELYNQFMALKKREKADSIFIYLRKYNEKHPLYLPVK